MEGPREWNGVPGDVSLTDREREVLHLKARRRTNAEIAEQLFISLTTVKWYVRQVYNKLGVNNRAEAVAAARQAGLLDRPSEPVVDQRKPLPTPSTPFVGRKQELRYLTKALTETRARLLTITGPGGIGKTRLALEVAEGLEVHFKEGVCWVSFSAQDELELVFSTVDEYITATILTALGLSIQGSDNLERLLKTYLHAREILIILDSFEHLLSGASFISGLLAGSRAAKFMITSRERLELPGEVLYPIQGLAYQEETGELVGITEAADLFLQSASRVSEGEYLGEQVRATIQRICQRLEGMPLAIELAADWTRLLPVAAIEAELDHGLEFLDTGWTSVRGIIDRSWKLLTDHQRASFARLAVFQGGFAREAARQVAEADLDTLSALFDKSLVQRTDEDRYALHDLLRQFAAEQLLARGDREAVRDAHCAYFATLAAGQKESVYRGDHSKMLADIDNIRAAWRWAVKRRRLEDLQKMLVPLSWFYNLRSYYAEEMVAMRLVIDALSTPEPQGLQGILYGAALTIYAGDQYLSHGDEGAVQVFRQGIDILRRLGAGEDLAWPLILSSIFLPDLQNREQNCLDGLRIFEELDHPYGIAFSLVLLGSIYRVQGRYAEAQLNIERGIAISRSLDDPQGSANGLRFLGHLNMHRGRFETARDNFLEECALWRGLSFPRLVGEALHALGHTYLADSNFKDAENAFHESLVEFERAGDEGGSFPSMMGLVQTAWQAGQSQKALDLLQEARPTLERRSDSEEQVCWWRLSGRVYQQRGEPDLARIAFDHALEFSLKMGGGLLVETILDFADHFHSQSEEEIAGRLMGYVQSQAGLPALLVQGRIEPLRNSLAAKLGQETLFLLLEEGAALDQGAVVDMLT